MGKHFLQLLNNCQNIRLRSTFREIYYRPKCPREATAKSFERHQRYQDFFLSKPSEDIKSTKGRKIFPEVNMGVKLP